MCACVRTRTHTPAPLKICTTAVLFSISRAVRPRTGARTQLPRGDAKHLALHHDNSQGPRDGGKALRSAQVHAADESSIPGPSFQSDGGCEGEAGCCCIWCVYADARAGLLGGDRGEAAWLKGFAPFLSFFAKFFTVVICFWAWCLAI